MRSLVTRDAVIDGLGLVPEKRGMQPETAGMFPQYKVIEIKGKVGGTGINGGDITGGDPWGTGSRTTSTSLMRASLGQLQEPVT